MKRKSIEQNLKSKLTSWLSSIEDIKLSEDIRESLIVSGGSIASMFLNEPVNDYDIYLKDMDVVKRVAEYYTKNMSIEVLDGRNKSQYIDDYMGNRSEGHISEVCNQYAVALRNLKEDQIKLLIKEGGYAPTYFEENPPKYRPVYFSANAISLSDNVQIVLRFHGTPEQVHKTFDFMHATNYFTFEEGLVTNADALESLLSKQLLYQGSKYPLTSVIRSKKFVKRGFSISAGEYLKMMFQISQLDLTNIDVLEEQLIGIDVAYFSKLIEILREHYGRHPSFVLTPEYLNSLIDKVFKGSENEE